jgi:hypothetical protein
MANPVKVKIVNACGLAIFLLGKDDTIVFLQLTFSYKDQTSAPELARWIYCIPFCNLSSSF